MGAPDCHPHTRFRCRRRPSFQKQAAFVTKGARFKRKVYRRSVVRQHRGVCWAHCRALRGRGVVHGEAGRFHCPSLGWGDAEGGRTAGLDGDMKQYLWIPAFVVVLLAASLPAQAADCFADYKAKQDNPLRLHYGVVQLSGECSKSSARQEISSRLAPAGWTLLNVLSVFGPEGLEQRKADAGPNYLRF